MATARTVFKRVAIGAVAAVGLLVVIMVLAPALLPSHIHVERSGQIDKSPEEVYAVVSDLNQYRRWDPFSDEDPTAKATVTGEGVGQVYEWQGEKIGRGSMTLARLDPPRSVIVQMQILEPMNDQFEAGWKLEPSGEGTRITWTFDKDAGYLERWMGLAMDTMLGGAFEKGLTKLKSELEK